MRVERIGDATLYLGDCRDILPTLPKVDAVITDPPYGIGANKMTLGNGARRIERGESSWDDEAPPPDFFTQCAAMSSAQIYWGGNYYGLPRARCWLVWDKCTGANDFADCELAWTSLDMVVKKKVIPWVGANAKDDGERQHPTQKPIALMEWCLSFVPNARTILDPFMGSGTTGVACMNLGRSFIGIEREPKYFDIACRRIEQAYKQRPLFEAEQPSKPVQLGLETA
jgi:site-specific DNA-methyltransferase (adenine-specific)/modification methylase